MFGKRNDQLAVEDVAASDSADPSVTRKRPAYTVTWPTLPSGIRTAEPVHATSPADAVRQALATRSYLERTTTIGYRINFGATPEVWLIDQTGARHVAGPTYC
jgi:hypothetical protein